jgi:NAD(P)-dependent dehydrogenase (short-subunit alcohol dehydrogenase family)
MSLAGKRVMVVGGSSGIGLAAARRLASAGARVIVVGRAEDKLARAKTEIGGDVETRAADLADEAAARRLFDDIGPLEHLVITAGGSPAWGPFLELEPMRLRAAFEGKFWPYFHAARYGAPRIAKDGSILFVTGGASRSAIPGTAGLAAVNGAIAAMARTLARELAPIRVNVLSPGFVDTPAYDAMPADARANLYRRMAEAVPLGRIGAADELAEAVVFLLGNGFTTGAVLDVDGGRRLV